MNKALQDLAEIHYGKSPKGIRVDSSVYPIFGTGGHVGYAIKPLFKAPGIVVGRKGTLGNPIFSPDDFWAIDTTYAILPKSGVDAKWIYYNLLNYDLSRLNEATGVPSINRDYLYQISFCYLEPEEQHKIAEIFSTVDDAIEQTEALIRKYQRIKQGLMQDLLTRGVDENGELRCESKYCFKDSKIGHIPSEWEVTDFEHLVNHITTRWIPRNAGGSFPCLNLENIESETGQVNGFSDAIENASTKTIFQKGDILFGKLRPYLKKYWIADVNGVCTTEILVFRAQSSIDHRYIYYLVQSEKFINYTISSSFGTKMPRTSWDIIKRYMIGKPDFEEQKRISKILFTIDSQIETSRVELLKLYSFKKGLMQDLLTGKVRVTALLEK